MSIFINCVRTLVLLEPKHVFNLQSAMNPRKKHLLIRHLVYNNVRLWLFVWVENLLTERDFFLSFISSIVGRVTYLRSRYNLWEKGWKKCNRAMRISVKGGERLFLSSLFVLGASERSGGFQKKSHTNTTDSQTRRSKCMENAYVNRSCRIPSISDLNVLPASLIISVPRFTLRNMI